MRIYVSTYAKYNAGNLSGGWLDVGDFVDKEDFCEAARALHPDESDPELMFQDVEGIPGDLVSESHIKPDLFEFAALDDDQRAIVRAFWEYDPSASVADVLERYIGEYESAADYAEEYTREGWGVPDHLRFYVDWESMAEDMQEYYFAQVKPAQVFVFRLD